MAKTAAKQSVLRKAAPKKGSKKQSSIKYADKSAGQPGLVPIFNELVSLMTSFEKGSLKKSGGKDGQVGLVSHKAVEIAGKKAKDAWFAGALVQKGFVGFYFMPVYTIPEMKSEIQPELLKCLKGKTCFHIRKMDDQVFRQIKDALKKGCDLYKKKGWIS
jgi:hypothetical protein